MEADADATAVCRVSGVEDPRPLRKFTRKNSSRTVVVLLIPLRSSSPSAFLDRQQSRVECVGVGTREDPFQRELRMEGIHKNIPFAGSDHGGYPQCR